MSQTLTIIALGALVLALVCLFLYFRAEAREIAQHHDRRPVPGKFFIPLLIACTFSGMAITEWRGVCSLSPWGFIAGIVIGTGAELVMYRRWKRAGIGTPV
jgi:hypothetical protein